MVFLHSKQEVTAIRKNVGHFPINIHPEACFIPLVPQQSVRKLRSIDTLYFLCYSRYKESFFYVSKMENCSSTHAHNGMFSRKYSPVCPRHFEFTDSPS